jgi:hypothetical protein
MLHRHLDQLVTDILSQIAKERGKLLDKIKYLLLIRASKPINRLYQNCREID